MLAVCVPFVLVLAVGPGAMSPLAAIGAQDAGESSPSEPGVAEDTPPRSSDTRAARWQMTDADEDRLALREIHVLRVEFAAPSDGGGVVVLVDGEPVDTATGATLHDLITERRGAPFALSPAPGEDDGAGDETDEAASSGEGEQPRDAEGEVDRDRPGDPADAATPADRDRDRGRTVLPDGMILEDGGRNRGPRGWRPGRERVGDIQRPGESLDAREVAEVMAVIEDFEPALHRRLRDLQARNPGQLSALLERLSGRWLPWVRLRREDPRAYALRVSDQQYQQRTLNLQIRHRGALDAGRTEDAEAIAAELGELVREHFDVRTEMRRHELESMREQFERLEASLERRLADRKRIIADYLESILGEPTFRSDF